MKVTKKAADGQVSGSFFDPTSQEAKDILTDLAKPSQSLPATFLIGSLSKGEFMSKTCESAKTLVGYSEELSRWCVIQIRCKRWGCRHCGERKMTHYAWRCQDAKPNRLVTLTVNNPLWETPRQAFDETKRQVTALAVRTRRLYGEFEYFKVLEVTKKGWPHYHLIVRSKYIPQHYLSDLWNELTGAPIVDVRKLKKSKDVFFYVMKYLAKQKYIPWTNRRVSWSRSFFDDTPFDSGPGLRLTQVGWIDEHPENILMKHFRPVRLEPYSKDCWTLQPGTGYPVGRSLLSMRMARKKKSQTKS